MQRVTNCIVIDNNHALLLKKPRRGWYAIPGGKMEQGESIKESVIREYREETALRLQDPELIGAFTFSIYKNQSIIQEWMMFTFICKSYEGKLTDYCEEGELEWIPLENIKNLPMAEGDREIYEHVLTSKAILYGAFSYTEGYELLEAQLDPFNN
ncbi:NUDIX hydrolase [Virgibacillus profundi]|uniref:NUDIX hydrolase n=1 Tax=Virgibacillus profundi TaxID=2024555 RepID=A0A2A2I8P9_9BACI|nr:8-oxo-dGTP diphosphatase [Virgibacillus profundi]PAV27758.1 NUDIX hydrolase [Virgibacillus profundi]PXY51913.1 8-oxo-dGTP diphosphatase [Virgibacillus profundi]